MPTLDAGAIAAISVAVVLLTQLVKFAGLPDKAGPLAALVFAAAGVALWAFSNLPGGAEVRRSLWDLFAGWLLVASSAAGVYGFSRAASSAVITRGQAPPTGGALSDPVVKN